MDSPTQKLSPFQAVYATFWNKPFDSFLDDAPANDGGQILRYISRATIQKLELHRVRFMENVLFIRNEFVSAFDTIESMWKKDHVVDSDGVVVTDKPGMGGVVVTGQPGIGECYFFAGVVVLREINNQGKTVFLFYVLFRRLCAGLPTALQVFDDRFFLFTEEGFSEHNLEAKNASQLPKGTWALADSSELIHQPCSAFLATSPREVWIIQATSPKISRWKEWSKQRIANKYVMDWFNPNELLTLG
jgi:hypothetical protein